MPKIKILITGAKGQLGKCLLDRIHPDDADVTAVDLPEMNISDARDVEKYLGEGEYDYVINCAAYTNVGNAGDNEDSAILANGYGPKLLAEACEKTKTRLIHISTDYVYDGTPGIKTEEAPTGPLNTYGRTKLLGDTEIQNIAKRGDLEYMILRTSWLYSEYGNNFLLTTLKNLKEGKTMNVVDDQFGCPTYAGDLADFIVFDVIYGNENSTKPFKSGVYHFSNLGYTTWYDFACAIMYRYRSLAAYELNEITNGDVKPCKTSDYPSKVERPMYGLLSKDKVKKEYDADIPQWEHSVRVVVKKVYEQYV